MFIFVAYKTPYGENSCISFDNVCGYIAKDGRDWYLLLMPVNEKYEQMSEKIKYLIEQKSNISVVYCYNSRKIRNDSDDDLPHLLDPFSVILNVILTTLKCTC